MSIWPSIPSWIESSYIRGMLRKSMLLYMKSLLSLKFKNRFLRSLNRLSVKSLRNV